MPLVLLILLSALAPAFGQLSGAIYTSVCDGTIVNKNIYDDGTLVFLNGGPQLHPASSLNDGVYFFQVTIPSGALLLSFDSAFDRLVLVQGGNIVGRCDAFGTLLEPGGSAGCPPDGAYPHPDGPLNPLSLNIPVQLWPFNETTNQGGEYKAWLIAWHLADGTPTGTSVADDGVTINFVDRWAKTDNFKIKVPPCTVDCGNVFFGNLSGTKFYDSNMNHIADPSELDVVGWTIEIHLSNPDNTPFTPNEFEGGLLPAGVVEENPGSGDGVYLTTTLAPDGHWIVPGIPGGTFYTVCEQIAPGWMQTAPGTMNDPIPAGCTSRGYSGQIDFAGDNVPGLDFGNIALGRFCGAKFYDKNMNGTLDSGEAGVGGVTINVVVHEPDGSTVNATLTTAADGSFCSDYYPDGSTYSVSETLGAPWIQTAPAGNLYSGAIGAAPFAGSPAPGLFYDVSYTIPDITGLNFGNILTGRIKGLKFYDKNNNGALDSGEAGVGGFTIHLVVTYPDGSVHTSDVTTAADGTWSAGPFPDGSSYSVSETLPTDGCWKQTMPAGNLYTGTITSSGPYTVGSTIPDVTGLNFGNILQTTLSGSKFYDTNANGKFDSGEPAIKGFKIKIVYTAPGGVATTVYVYTDASGNFTAGPFPDGTTFAISEVLPVGGWTESFPSAGYTYTGSISAGSGPFTASSCITPLVGFQFGNFMRCAGGGLTLGFWSNNNGYAAASAKGWPAVFNVLNTSNLRNADGTIAKWAVSSTGYKAFQTWLTKGTTTPNMATLLSVQLAATEMNVLNGNSSAGEYVYAPGTLSANSLGYAKLGDLITEAITELGKHGITLANGTGSAYRAYQSALQSAFANVNQQTGNVVVCGPVTVITPSPY